MNHWCGQQWYGSALNIAEKRQISETVLLSAEDLRDNDPGRLKVLIKKWLAKIFNYSRIVK